MVFLKRHSFKIAVLSLCAAMGIYLLITNVFEQEEKLPVLQAAPDFQMNDIDDKPVSLHSTNGKVRIVYFFFASCPDVCPPTTYLLSEVQEKLRAQGTLDKEVELISITFDPIVDTPEVIREFAERTSVEFDGWSFLRGEEEATIELAKKFQVGVKRTEDGSFIHFNIISLVDQNGQIRDWINGNDQELTADDIVAKINQLL